MASKFAHSVFFAALCCVWSCTPTSGPSGSASLKPGQRILLFDPAEVSQVEMTAYSPTSHARWSARFQSTPDGWKIQGATLTEGSDTRAHAQLIAHWLDALSALTLKERFESAQPLERLGLVSPRAAVHIQSGGRSYQIALGDRAPVSDGSLAHFAQWKTSDGTSTEQGTVAGAALQMLEHLTTFQRMRATAWSPVERSQIVLSTVQSPERLEAALAQWTHLQILDFLDAPQSRPTLPARPTREIILSVRDSQSGKLRRERYSIWKQGGRVFGRTSSRPTLVELYPQTLSALDALQPFTR